MEIDFVWLEERGERRGEGGRGEGGMAIDSENGGEFQESTWEEIGLICMR